MPDLSLREIEPFARCDPETLDRLERCARRRALSEGEVLFEEGHPGEFVFVVEEGRLSIRKASDGGPQVELRMMGPREVGGLTSVTTGGTRSATVVAAEAAHVLTLPGSELDAALAERSDLSRALVGYFARKVRAKNRVVASLVPAPDEGRTRVAMFDTKPYERTAFLGQTRERVALSFLEPKLSEETARLAEGHPVVCAFVNDDLGAPVLQALRDVGVHLVALRCAGFNNVDLEAARRLSIDVVRVPAYSPHAVAEHAMALVLALNRKVHRAHNRVREANFNLAGLEGFDLYGKTAGIVGFGQIGRCLADILQGFGMRVLVFDPYLPEGSGLERVELDELLARADVVSLHAPLTPETYHLVDGRRIAAMKRGAMLINTSRGALVDAAALIDGLKSGQVGAAGLDVYEEESEYFFEDRSDRVITDDVLARLIGFNNVLVTSHQAFLTHEALDNIAETTLGSVEEWIDGRRGADLTHAVP